jgi:hypothetical protein
MFHEDAHDNIADDVYLGINDTLHAAFHSKEKVLLYQGINESTQLDEGAKPYLTYFTGADEAR